MAATTARRRRRIHEVGREPLRPVSSIEPPRRSWRSELAREGRRLLALGAIAGAAFLVWLFVVQPILPEEETAAPAQQQAAPAEAQSAPPPPRPEGIPARIPQWAWAMHEWHSTPGAERGTRPDAAPNRLPAWYWEWRAWRIQVEA